MSVVPKFKTEKLFRFILGLRQLLNTENEEISKISLAEGDWMDTVKYKLEQDFLSRGVRVLG